MVRHDRTTDHLVGEIDAKMIFFGREREEELGDIIRVER